ncbi:hypothetical protein P7K49_007119 [Saguinus oedipus]|uniref:Uncharacterized protein n=1 Tax=Saguinus oedipus TaxID=9490 RepID=A0ABQ9VWC2_SAGOE|nr:hypothetical protein P7K49_007119 [Saguinus oedipus]
MGNGMAWRHGERGVKSPCSSRPAEIVDEEEDGEKANKDAEQNEGFSGMNGDLEEKGGGEATDAPQQVEEILDHSEERAGPARVNGVTDEENGEELDQVNTELQLALDKERTSQGDGSGQDEPVLLRLILELDTHRSWHSSMGQYDPVAARLKLSLTA